MIGRNDKIKLKILVIALLVSGLTFVFPERKTAFSDGSLYKLPNSNIVIICIDSLRADHVSSYGYERNTTPCIDSMAKSGVLFSNAISQSPWTKPSVASLFSSMYMSVHNVWYSYRETNDKNENTISCKLSDDIVTLAEILKINGYSTVAFGQKYHLRKNFGFKQGFDLLNMRLGKAPRITKSAISWLREKRPFKFFIYLHYDDAHYPYRPPKNFRMFDTYKSNANVTGKNIKLIRQGKLEFKREDINHMIAAYDGEVKYVDSMIASFLNKLDKLGYGNNTTIVIWADHGEEFLEHGGVGHRLTLYEELIHVPLIMKGPTIPKNRKIDSLVQSIDIAPTILDIVDLVPDREWEGKSLIPQIFQREQVYDYVFSERKRNDTEDFLRAVRTKKWKLIKNFNNEESHLYDLEKDPGEFVDVKKKYPRKTKELELYLNEWLKKEEINSSKKQFKATVKIDETAKERLKSLGYAN